MTEGALTAKLCRDLEALNALTFAIVGSEKQQVGWPDRYIHHTYWHGWVEFKAHNGILSQIQRVRIAALNDRVRGKAYVVRFLEPNNYKHMRIEGDGVYKEIWGAKELLRKLSDLR